MGGSEDGEDYRLAKTERPRWRDRRDPRHHAVFGREDLRVRRATPDLGTVRSGRLEIALTSPTRGLPRSDPRVRPSLSSLASLFFETNSACRPNRGKCRLVRGPVELLRS